MAQNRFGGIPVETETTGGRFGGIPVESSPPPEQPNPDEYEGRFKEFIEGVGSGATKVVQGVAELGALASDATLGTDYHEDVVEGFESFRKDMGIDPQGLAGSIGEVGVQFVLPAGIAAKAVGGINAVAKAGGVGKFMAQVGAGVGADFVTATNDTTTIGDFFEGGPTETAELVGLENEERAVQGLINKFKVGVEGGAGVVAAPIIARSAVEAARGTAAGAKIVGEQIPLLPEAARAVQRQTRKVGDYLGKVEDARRMGQEQGMFAKGVADTMSILRYRGMLPEEVGEARSLIPGLTEAEAQAASKLTKILDKDINNIIAKSKNATDGMSPLTRDNILNGIDQYLTLANRTKAKDALASLPKDLQAPVKIMRTHLDELSEKILDSDFIKQNDVVQKATGKQLSETIRGNLGSYMRRRYRMFEDPNFKPDDQMLKEAAEGFKADPVSVQSELENIAKSLSDPRGVRELGLSDDFKLLGQVTDQQAEIARDNFLKRYKNKTKPSVQGVGRVAEQRLNTKLFIDRQNIKDYQRALLGEVKNPLENYVATVSDLAEFAAVDNYFGRIRKLAETNEGIGKIFRKIPPNITDEQVAALGEEGFVVLGSKGANSFGKKATEEDILSSGWGSLHGYAVPERVYKDLTRFVAGDTGVAGNWGRSVYSTFLQGKGFVQYGKTVLSPVTQVRNVTTASAFALAQGNIGKGANLWESVGLVFKNLKDATPEQAQRRFKKLQELGVVNSQAELKELQELVSKGLGYTDDKFIAGTRVKERTPLGAKLADNPYYGFLRGTGKKFENAYQGGDDVWKVYNFSFESNKLRNALDKMDDAERASYIQRKTGRSMSAEDFIDEEAARIVRNTVPNYNLAPEGIKALRKLPVGNFIAFPYEILRTGANTIARGIDELADESIEIQKIGLRRLTGALTTFSILPATLSQMGYAMSGVSKEEMDAYQRSIAPPWERNARLIPVGRQEDGTPKYVNYSYSNPYDILEKTLIAALNKAEEGRALGKGGGQIVWEAGQESLTELFAPFTEESIAAAKIRDVLDPQAENIFVRSLGNIAGGRAGRTVTGAKVYNPQGNAGDKVSKSFAHIMDALLPSIVPVDVRGGEFEPSRFVRSLVNSLGLEDATGISAKDRMGREREITTELFRAFSGVTQSDTQASDAMKFKGYEFAKARQDASNIFNSVARRQNVDSAQLLKAYEDANEARYRVHNQFYQTIQAMRTFGMPDNKIRKTLKDAGIGGVNEIMRGRYVPLTPSDSVLNEMRRNKTIQEYPRSEIRSIILQQKKRKFGEQSFQPKVSTPETTPLPTFNPRFQGTKTPTSPSTFNPRFQQDSSLQAPQFQPTQARAPGPVNPALLGDNPVTAALNAQIANRRG